MEKWQIWTIAGMVLTGVPLATFYLVKTINKFTHSPTNSLIRSHNDVELQNVDQIQSNLRDIDISSLPEFPTSQAVLNQIPIRWDLYPAPRFSYLTNNTATRSSPPDYSQITGDYINSPLEDNFRLLLLALIFIIIIALFWKIKNNLRIKYLKMIIQILGILISIFIMNFLILYNLLGLTMSILFPFSVFEIDFRDSHDWKFKSIKSKSIISYHKLQNLTQDLEILLNSLDDETDYSMGLSYISNYKKWSDNKCDNPPLFITDHIIVNKESDPILISEFIMAKILIKGYFNFNDLFDELNINSINPVILTSSVPIHLNI